MKTTPYGIFSVLWGLVLLAPGPTSAQTGERLPIELEKLSSAEIEKLIIGSFLQPWQAGDGNVSAHREYFGEGGRWRIYRDLPPITEASFRIEADQVCVAPQHALPRCRSIGRDRNGAYYTISENAQPMRVIISRTSHLNDDKSPQRLAVLSAPRWARKPSERDLQRLAPQGGKWGVKQGRSALRCRISQRGTLERCVIISEDPASEGLGAAALEAASLYRLQASPDGSFPEGAVVTVTQIWRAGDRKIQPHGPVGR